jgi:hypothetical protein
MNKLIRTLLYFLTVALVVVLIFGLRMHAAMLGRRSSLMGALVQAINVAIHAAIEQRSQYPKNVSPSLEIGQIPESNIS